LGDTRIGLDAPPGFADTLFTGSPRLQDLSETLTSASNRILLFAITDADMRRFTVGDTPEYRRYTIAVTPKGLERDRVTASAFNAFVSDALRELGPPPSDRDYAKYLALQPAGKVTLLAELRRDPDVVSVLQGTRLPETARSNDPPRYLLSSTTLLLLRGKALNIAVYSLYDNAADEDWIKATTVRWVEELQRLNSR
jgi:hypothetical protein